MFMVCTPLVSMCQAEFTDRCTRQDLGMRLRDPADDVVVDSFIYVRGLLANKTPRHLIRHLHTCNLHHVFHFPTHITPHNFSPSTGGIETPVASFDTILDS